MSINNETDKQTYNGNGSNLDFAIAHTIVSDDSAETEVWVRDESDPNNITETLQVEGALQDYTLTGASPPGTPFNNNVRFNSAPSSDQKVIVKRAITLTQPLDISESDDFPAESFETQLDRLAAQIQFLQEQLTRVPRLRNTEQFGTNLLGQSFANRLIWVNDSNNGFEWVSPAEVLASAVADGLTAQYDATIANSQTETDVSNFPTLDNTVHTSALLFGEITRGNTGGHIILSIRYINSTWVVQTILENTDTASGVTFNMNGGSLEYSSGSEGAGELKFRLLRFAA